MKPVFTISELSGLLDNQRDFVETTPMLRARSVPGLFLKAENLQVTGSFKVRPAFAQFFALGPEERRRGVVTSSSGNFAIAAAYVARMVGVSCTVVMMPSASRKKRERAEALGARIVLCGDSYESRQKTVQELVAKEGLTAVHPFDAPEAILGNGTLGWEIVEQVQDLRRIVVPVSGGGLLAGIATAVRQLCPRVELWGVQAAGSNAAVLSWEAKRRVSIPRANTIADGLTVTCPGERTFPILLALVDGILQVEETAVRSAVTRLLDEEKLVVEPAGAVPVAAVLEGLVPAERTVCVLSGGNLDWTRWERES
ncbi:MAG: bifunctional threonine ammonia-lyase/L-serine ammonia-lyase TdcB [Acidobacteriota bacterium]